MKKLILCLLIISRPLQAEVIRTPDPCLGDVACQYRMLDEQAKKEKQAEQAKLEEYREEMLETQAAQLEETQKQNQLIEENIEVNQSTHANDRQMEQEDPVEYQNYENEDEEVLK